MGASPPILERAAARSATVRSRYRDAGVWLAGPVDFLADAAVSAPTSLALMERRGGLTYAELDAAVERATGSLSELGVAPGSLILLVVGNDRASVIAFHAAMRLDAVVLLASPGAGRAHVQEIVTATGVTIGLAPGDWLADGETPAGCAWHPLDAIEEGIAPDVRCRPQRDADEPSVVLFTSGTTARPKGVVHSISTLQKASANYIAAAGLGSADRILLISPLASVTGVLQALFIGPMLEIAVVLEDRWEPAATFSLLVDSGATWYGGPDLLLDRMLDEAVRAGDVTVPLTAVYLGGTMLDRRVVERVERDFGIVVMRAYGSSEVPISTSGLRGEPAEIRHADDGVPLDDVEVRIGSSNDPGECAIRGPHAFLGYIDRDDDARAFEGDWFLTGDVAEHVDGRLRVVGRIRDIVIRNGMKIPIAEVEEALNGLPGVIRTAGFSVVDRATGEHLAMAIRLEPGVSMSLGAAADELTAAGLPKYKLPEELVLWDDPFPETATGKVERNKLEALSAGRPRELAPRLR